jgi:DNA-binding NarL/FixJ family response regulator
MTQPLKVVIAEDHYLLREGTRQLLETSGVVKVLATVGDAAGLHEAVESLSPDAAIVDIRMPPSHETEGIAAARAIRAEHPGVGVVVLSQYANALYAFALFRDGTEGLAYLLKDKVGNVDELVRALLAVTQGGSVIDSNVVESLLSRKATMARGSLGALTDREVEVLAQMAQGKSNAGISDALFISESAVEKHINSIMMKLELDPEDSSLNRRVAAVLTFLHSYQPSDQAPDERESPTPPRT